MGDGGPAVSAGTGARGPNAPLAGGPGVYRGGGPWDSGGTGTKWGDCFAGGHPISGGRILGGPHGEGRDPTCPRPGAPGGRVFSRGAEKGFPAILAAGEAWLLDPASDPSGETLALWRGGRGRRQSGEGGGGGRVLVNFPEYRAHRFRRRDGANLPARGGPPHPSRFSGKIKNPQLPEKGPNESWGLPQRGGDFNPGGGRKEQFQSQAESHTGGGVWGHSGK